MEEESDTSKVRNYYHFQLIADVYALRKFFLFTESKKY